MQNAIIRICHKINHTDQSKRPPAIKSSSSSGGGAYFFFYYFFLGSSFLVSLAGAGADLVAATAGPDDPILAVP